MSQVPNLLLAMQLLMQCCFDESNQAGVSNLLLAMQLLMQCCFDESNQAGVFLLFFQQFWHIQRT